MEKRDAPRGGRIVVDDRTGARSGEPSKGKATSGKRGVLVGSEEVEGMESRRGNEDAEVQWSNGGTGCVGM